MSEHDSLSSDEEKPFPSESAFKEANCRITEVYKILKQEATRVKKEREAFESVAKKLKDVHFGTTVKLNVGGHYFTTSVHTLNKDPGSMLHAMFSGRFDTKPAEDGSYFIDRDGTHFRFILNYLRTGKLLLPDDKLLRNEVLAEAEFYQIKGIIEELNPKPFSKSTILNKKQCETLAAWLPRGEQLRFAEMRLLYRATVNGWSSSDFHKCCDNKGATVIVVKQGANIFGGYTKTSWNSSGTYVKCNQAFLFSLENASGTGAVKLTLHPGKEGNAIYCHSNYGPTFGGSGTYVKCNQAFLFSLKNTSKTGAVKLSLHPGREGNAIYCDSSYGPTFGNGHDLYIVNNPNRKNCSSSMNNTYELPPNCSGTTFLAGQQNFTIYELEVFGFQE